VPMDKVRKSTINNFSRIFKQDVVQICSAENI
jgi:hypothetical protein